MFTKIWHKITGHRRENPHQSLRAASRETGIPKSTIHDHDKRLAKRDEYAESIFWESEAGQNFIKRILVGSIYTFAIKGGVGAGRIEEFLTQLRLEKYAGVSRQSIHRMVKEIEGSILRYKELREKELSGRNIMSAKEEIEYLEVVLGLDETWLDKMLLVCQELSSGFLFLSMQAKKETPKAGTNP